MPELNQTIAIFGYNSKSFELIAQLQKNHNNLIILDADAEKVSQAHSQGLNARKMDYRRDADLIELGIADKISTLFCFLETDSENVFLTLSARVLNKDIKIIAIINQPDSAEKLHAAGANKIINPYEICSNKAYQLLAKPNIAGVLEKIVFGGRADLFMAEITIPSPSCLENTFTSQLNLTQYDLFLIGVVDKELGDSLYFSLGEQDHKLDSGDILVILGSRQNTKKFKSSIGIIND